MTAQPRANGGTSNKAFCCALARKALLATENFELNGGDFHLWGKSMSFVE
jgi:hypothetical protein